MVNFTINGQAVSCEQGETILTVARKNDIYIPTMCYLQKTTPCASCRLCSVEAEGVDGFVLSCQAPATEGLAIITETESLKTERTNIMRMYDVNHPLECGVCDKSGACDLQNKTLEFDISTQFFTAKDQPRKIDNWGKINYDPNLCILCEKCTHVCNEVIGDDAIDLLFGGYNSKVIPKNSDTLDCTYCGECISVCPVGALISDDFQYTANVWELNKVPASCSHCSAACALEYEVKHESIDSMDKEKIYRVTNDFEVNTLCGAGRFAYDYENAVFEKDEKAFDEAIAAIKSGAIRFNSTITNEEAMILQRLKEKLGIKLFNQEALNFQKFMSAYSTTSGTKLYSATLESIKKSDGIIIIGSRIVTDNPGVRYAITTAARHNGARVAYMHPLEDSYMKNTATQFVKYEVGTEEGVLALVAKALLEGKDLPVELTSFFDSLDEGYLEAESNVGEDEMKLLSKQFIRTKKQTLILGADLISHAKAENIARIAGMIEKHTNFKVMIVSPSTNTLGVSLICDLDEDKNNTYSVGYNTKGDFILSSLGNAKLDMPALNQQEGTFTNIDKRVVPTNVALPYNGYVLNDLAMALGVKAKYTIDYTAELPEAKGFKNVKFDDLEVRYGSEVLDTRGYELEMGVCNVKGAIDAVNSLPEFNGTVLYNCNPVLQFNANTNMAHQLDEEACLLGSEQFAIAAKLQDGDKVEFSLANVKQNRTFKIDADLKGTVALNPSYDLGLDATTSSYRYETVKISKMGS
ncbi:MAG: ferredoxin [Arcobacter sp.]|nr:MAG: ferredoxin [Arcobacter sp.]